VGDTFASSFSISVSKIVLGPEQNVSVEALCYHGHAHTKLALVQPALDLSGQQSIGAARYASPPAWRW
jgi:hypothetical protein